MDGPEGESASWTGSDGSQHTEGQPALLHGPGTGTQAGVEKGYRG